MSIYTSIKIKLEENYPISGHHFWSVGIGSKTVFIVIAQKIILNKYIVSSRKIPRRITLFTQNRR